MNTQEKSSVQLGDAETDVQLGEAETDISRRSCCAAQLSCTIRREETRFRNLLASEAKSVTQEDNHKEQASVTQEDVACLDIIRSHLESMQRIQQTLRRQAKEKLNYDGFKDGESVRRQCYVLKQELLAKRKRYDTVIQQVADAEECVRRKRASVSALESRLAATKAELLALRNPN